LCLCIPLGSISIGIARIQDSRIYARKLSRNLYVEVRQRLSRSVQDRAIQNRVDDSTGILDGDTLSGSVPSGIYQVSLSSALLHSLNKLLCILRRMQLQECLAKASGEGRCRLCDSTLGSCKLCCETGQEVVLGLLRCQNRYRRKYAECIGGQEDYILRCRSCGYRTNNLLDVVDRVR